MWAVVVLFAKQRTQALPKVLRFSIQPKTTFHKTGRRGLDCSRALDFLAENFKVAHYRRLSCTPLPNDWTRHILVSL
jgi:hypothetical protein